MASGVIARSWPFALEGPYTQVSGPGNAFMRAAKKTKQALETRCLSLQCLSGFDKILQYFCVAVRH